MNIDQIKLFIAVYKTRSFAAVAKEHNMAASSVSRAIATLESQLKTRLFQRTTRNLAPTQIGEQYFRRIESLVEELEMAQQEIFNQNTEPFGSLKISASTSFGQTILAPLLKEFHKQYPNISLELLLSDSQVNLIDEQIDVAIRHGRLHDSNLIAIKLKDVRYVLVAHKDYLDEGKEIKHPQDIVDHPLISFSYSQFNKVWSFRNDKGTELVPISPILTISTAAAIKECVKDGVGLALLPDWIVEDELKEGSLVNVLPMWEMGGSDFEASIWLVYPSRSFVPTKTRVFINYLQVNC